MVKITIDTDDYPLINELPDPEGYIRKLLDREYSIFKSQHSPQIIRDVMGNVEDAMNSIRDFVEQGESDRNDTMTKLNLLMANPSKKGAFVENLGDELFAEYLDKHAYNIETTSKTPKSADRRITKQGFEMLFDWKHYATNVNTGEVEKLKRDMDAQNIRCGILANADKGVARYTNADIDFFVNKRGQKCCLIVLGRVSDMPVKAVLAIYFLESIWKKCLQSESPNDTYEQTHNTFADVIQRTEELGRLVAIYEKHRDGIVKHLGEFNTELVGAVAGYRAFVQARLA
jgi:hypothetical protein